MSYKIATILLVFQLTFSLTTLTLVTVYNNAQFNPTDKRYMIGTLLSISSVNACLCECYNNMICFTVNYFAINQTCLLYSAQISQGQVRVVPTVMNAKVCDIGNRSLPSLKIFNRTNETIHAIWNTTTGGDSTPTISGMSIGRYYPTEPPVAAFDNNFTSEYTNLGNCNSTQRSFTCGVNTGLYFTPNTGPFRLVAFYFVASFNHVPGDPLTITIEGSNQNASALILGSSWILIYNGSAGLTNDPGRSNMGVIQTLSNSPIFFKSYRLLVTSQRGSTTSTLYSEFVIIGY